MTAAPGSEPPKYLRVAAQVRGQIADGTLRPGEPVPSGAALSRITGFSTLTCRKALRLLIADGVLVPGPSRNARPRVAAPGETPAKRSLTEAARTLSAALAARRRAAGLTQPQLAARADVSVTTVGHAETGRLWQSRLFWTRADDALRAGGDLLRLHDAYRAAAASPRQSPRGQADAAVRRDWAASAGAAAMADALGCARGTGQAAEGQGAAGRGAMPGTAPFPGGLAGGTTGPSCVLVVWADGTVTTVRPPGP